MRVTLILEQAPHAQAATRRTVEAGDLVIGRGADADWRIDDPDMYVSRTHCVVTVEGGEAVVRDASRGGLFLDGARTPLGPGNAAHLEDGMRLRLGDFVLRVDLEEATRGTDAAEDAPAPGGFVWADPPAPVAVSPRPDDLPTPFGERPAMQRPQETNGASFAFDDPFTLDPPPASDMAARHRDPFGLEGGDDAVEHPPPVEAGAAEPAEPIAQEAGNPAGVGSETGAAPDPFAWAPFSDDGREPHTPWTDPSLLPDPLSGPNEVTAEPPSRGRILERPPPDRRRPLPELEEPVPPLDPATDPSGPGPEVTGSHGDDALRAAFFRGLGLEPSPCEDAVDEMEAMGLRFRLLTEGLTALLRARAHEKRSARVAQTVIASAEVNPLKFTATVDEAVAALTRRRGPGYLDPEVAIRASFGDLHDHERRKWEALQQALRRMVDRFDPEAVEREMEGTGLLETLLAGGRGAKLWSLYQARYREIARAAEDRFLGEVGADFRDAYEGREP